MKILLLLFFLFQCSFGFCQAKEEVRLQLKEKLDSIFEIQNKNTSEKLISEYKKNINKDYDACGFICTLTKIEALKISLKSINACEIKLSVGKKNLIMPLIGLQLSKKQNQYFFEQKYTVVHVELEKGKTFEKESPMIFDATLSFSFFTKINASIKYLSTFCDEAKHN